MRVESKAYWEDIIAGDKRISPGRTITEADVVNFAGFTGSYDEEHVNAQFARNSAFGERIAHGLISLCVAEGLRTRVIWYNNDNLRGSTLIAFLGLDKLRFKRPLKLGDTIWCETEVIAKKATRKEDRGIVTFLDKVMNQDNEVIMECERTVMYKRRPVE